MNDGAQPQIGADERLPAMKGLPAMKVPPSRRAPPMKVMSTSVSMKGLPSYGCERSTRVVDAEAEATEDVDQGRNDCGNPEGRHEVEPQVAEQASCSAAPVQCALGEGAFETSPSPTRDCRPQEEERRSGSQPDHAGGHDNERRQ